MADFDKIEELQSILKEDPSDFQTRRELAMLLLDGGFPADALQHFLYLAKIFPTDSGLYYNIGIVYEKMKNYNKSEYFYLKAIEVNPEDLDSFYNLGLVYIEKEEYEKGVMCFNKVLLKDTDDSNSYFNMGICHLKMGDLDKALANFRKTTILNPDDIYAQFYIGNILKDTGDLNGATSQFQKVLEISPEYSWAYYNLAVIDFEQGNYDNAIVKLEKTLELNPKDLDAYMVYAKLLTKFEKEYDAVEITNRAERNCDVTGDFYYLKAQIQKKCQDYKNYLKNLDYALKNHTTLALPPKKVKNEYDKFIAENPQ